MKFSPCTEQTVGVEWELQLLHHETLDLSDGIIPLMELSPAAVHIKPEFIQSCVELTSCVANNSADAIAHLERLLNRLLRRLEQLDMSLCGAGTHPFCRRLALITPLPRYQHMEQESGTLARTHITFSTHVHVAMESGDQAMRTMSRLVPAVSALIALSANSPFWRGHDTGHAAYRHRILAAAPNYGLPPRFNDWRNFDTFLEAAMRGNMIRHFKDLHWDMRPHPDFGTLEIRAMDAASNLKNLHGLVAFARCLAIGLADAESSEIAEVLPMNLPGWIEKQNRYRAGLCGLEAEYIVDERGRHRSLRGLVADLLDFCRPIAVRFGELQGLVKARNMLGGHAGYEEQRRVYGQTNSARAVVKMLQQSLLDRCGLTITNSRKAGP